MSILAILQLLVVIVWVASSSEALSSKTMKTKQPACYRYFAYGSNMQSSILTTLRQVQPRNATAAVLPNYALRFNIGGGGFSGAAASVQPQPGAVTHGVLYTLTPEDFVRVGWTEGVPLVYQWKSCRVVKYVGNGRDAGRRALQTSGPQDVVQAYTLVSMFAASSNDKKEMSPSRYYRDLLLEGARTWDMDQDYVEQLEAVEVTRTSWIFSSVLSRRQKRAQ